MHSVYVLRRICKKIHPFKKKHNDTVYNDIREKRVKNRAVAGNSWDLLRYLSECFDNTVAIRYQYRENLRNLFSEFV